MEKCSKLGTAVAQSLGKPYEEVNTSKLEKLNRELEKSEKKLRKSQASLPSANPQDPQMQ